MSTAAQTAANQANARHSTGPTTEAGKKASSQNAMKHGFTSQTVLLPHEDRAAYAASSEGFRRDCNPANTIESGMVEELIALQWRLLRVPILEAQILSAESPDFKALAIISPHTARMKRQFSATLKEYQDQVTNRAAHEINHARHSQAAPAPRKSMDDIIAQFIQNEEKFAQSMTPPPFPQKG